MSNAPGALQDDVAAARGGDVDAFAALVRMHQKSVFNLALRILNDRDLAEDLSQDVFLELHRNLHTIESMDHLTFWLRKVTTHRAIDWVRRRGAAQLIDLDEAYGLAAAPNTEDHLWQRQVRRLLGSLKPDARAVVLLRYQEDMDPTDIAKTLVMPVNTVKSHLKRALAALRRSIESAGDEQ